MSLAVVRSYQLQSRNLHELALQRGGHIVGHRIRRRSRVVDLYLDDRIINGRQIADGQPEISQRSKQDDRDGQCDRHHRTANEDFREIHE